MPDDLALIRIIRRTIREAHEAGADYTGQGQKAVAAVMLVRPDLTASDAMTLVERVRQHCGEARAAPASIYPRSA